jgi:hypothetical protein
MDFLSPHALNSLQVLPVSVQEVRPRQNYKFKKNNYLSSPYKNALFNRKNI